MTLTEFLLARIDEDENVALAATGDYGWRVSLHKRGEVWADRDAAGYDAFLVASTEQTRLNVGLDEQAMHDADHIARHDPVRVLSECEAKRLLIDGFDSWGDDAKWTLRVLALPYSDHPDYPGVVYPPDTGVA